MIRTILSIFITLALILGVSFFEIAVSAAGCAGGVIFGGVGEDAELFQYIHSRT